jgi:hypothetical protein
MEYRKVGKIDSWSHSSLCSLLDDPDIDWLGEAKQEDILLSQFLINWSGWLSLQIKPRSSRYFRENLVPKVLKSQCPHRQ